MKKTLLLISLVACFWSAVLAQTVVPPTIKSKTTFAIVVDEASYKEEKTQVEAYRNSVEGECLGTYIILD